jgi:hypothetical protein
VGDRCDCEWDGVLGDAEGDEGLLIHWGPGSYRRFDREFCQGQVVRTFAGRERPG